METGTIDVERLSAATVDIGVDNRDWSEGWGEEWEFYAAPSCPECGDYAEWDDDEYVWTCRNAECETTEVESEGDDGPMMNYSYDLPHFDADLHESAQAIADLPLCIVDFQGDGYALALSGGGMDLSWEICEAFIRLGYLPPAHFASDLPKMAGDRERERYPLVLPAARRALTMAAERAAYRLERFDREWPQS